MRKIRRPSGIESGDWLIAFDASLRSADLSPRTVTGYRQDLEAFVRWYKALRSPEPEFSEISSMDLIAYRQHLIGLRRKPATVNRCIQALRRFCRWAHEAGRLKADPGREIRSVRIAVRRQPLGLVEHECHSLFRAAGQSGHGLAKRNLALVHLMIQAGLRVSEVASLVVSDLTINERSGSVHIRQGKGRKERTVPLNATARRALRAYLESRGNPGPLDRVFASKRGGPAAVRTIQSQISEIARRAGIKRIHVTPHTLRHTFALGYLRQNAGKLVELASLLGHESLDTTAIYTQPSAEELADDLERGRLNVYT